VATSTVGVTVAVAVKVIEMGYVEPEGVTVSV
jgi:hypothetical protein